MIKSTMFKRICLVGITGLVACAGRQGIAAETDVGVSEIAPRENVIVISTKSTTRDVTSEKIKSLPVMNVADILKAGDTVQDDRFHIRGCSAMALPYPVEGVTMKELFGSRGPIGVPGKSEENLTSADLWSLIESLYGDAGGFLYESENEAQPHFNLIDLVEAVNETTLVQKD